MKSRSTFFQVTIQSFTKTHIYGQEPVVSLEFMKIVSTLKTRLLFCLFAVMLLSIPRGALLAQTDEYVLKAAFVERFTRFVDWPDQKISDLSAKRFVIGIVGKNPFGKKLERAFKSRSPHYPKLVFRNFNAADSISCHLLFISRSAKKHLPQILKKIAGRPILSISDAEGFGRMGVHINLFISQDHLRFEINKEAAQKTGLRISSKLLKNAHIISSGKGL